MRRVITDDKIPPQAVDIEEAVLGAIIIEETYHQVAFELLDVYDFYKTTHQSIFSSVKSLHDKGEVIDLLTVVNQLRKDGMLEEVGGAYYITTLTNKVSSAANIEYWCRILNEKKIRRQIIEISSQYITSAYSDTSDTLELSANLLNDIEKITNSFSKHKDKSLEQIQIEHYEEVKKRVELRERGEFSGIKTPLKILTFTTRGWQPTDLIMLAARPSMGKTAFAIECIIAACLAGKKVVFFSLEMSEKQIMDRIYMNVSELSKEEIKYGEMSELSFKKYHTSFADISKWNLVIDDKSGIDTSYIKTKLKKIGNVDMVVIDYLQIMSLKGKPNSSKNDDISDTTGKLKGIAKEFNIPVICLSQLSRECEKRTNKRPQLSDLRDGGSIEQDADLVMFLYRDAYYEIKENEKGEDTTGLIEIDIKKHRNGEVKRIFAKHNNTLTKFYDKEIYEYETYSVQPQPSFHHPDEYKTDVF